MKKINIQLFGGRGASVFNTSTKNGKLKPQFGKPSDQLDVSALSGFPVALKEKFEEFLDMKNEKVEYGYLIDKNGKVVAGARGNEHSVAIDYDGLQEGMTVTHNHPSKYGFKYTFTANKSYNIN